MGDDVEQRDGREDDDMTPLEARWRVCLGFLTDHWFVWPQLGVLGMMVFLLWDETLLGKPAPLVVFFLMIVWGALAGYEGMTLSRRREAGRERRAELRWAAKMAERKRRRMFGLPVDD